MFHGLTITLSLPLLSLLTPLLSLSPSQYLYPSLPKSVLLQRTLFFNPIWWGPQLPHLPSLPHGEMYANVARLQMEIRLLALSQQPETMQPWKTQHCSTTNRKIRTCQIWSVMNYAALATEYKRWAFWWILCISSSVLAITHCCREICLYLHKRSVQQNWLHLCAISLTC